MMMEIISCKEGQETELYNLKVGELFTMPHTNTLYLVLGKDEEGSGHIKAFNLRLEHTFRSLKSAKVIPLVEAVLLHKEEFLYGNPK